ncbi:unnamed protein product [Urochloa decumbens]|uniref:DUF4220 domain-containing protein n=1 Tax=Urochloa decumbens TaxID=240449 RepID=A0ABC9FMM4_9POAL
MLDPVELAFAEYLLTGNPFINAVSNEQQLWDEWELQVLVLASFALQAFFLFAAGIRRRNTSAVLRIALWLAYLSADYVAVFVLGHLTRHVGGPRHQLVLLWAPVLLLHLGGQETITAFSMQDNELWKRHLLGLATQVALAVYVVTKSWRRGGNSDNDDGLLAAAVALLFVAGTVKYAERTWALKAATSDTITGNRMTDLLDTMRTKQNPAGSAAAVERYNHDIVGRRKWWLQEEYSGLVEAAGYSFPNCVNALMDIPVAPWLLPEIWGMVEQISGHLAVAGQEDSSTFPSRAYKMGEIQLSLMYDHIYTKVGLRYALLALPVLTLAATSSALALFTAARKGGGGASYSAVDRRGRLKLGASSRLAQAIFRCICIELARPYSKPLWSNRWAQHNLVAGCIREKQAGVFTRAMRRLGLAGDTKFCRISDETKELICSELDDEERLSQFSHVRGTGILSRCGHGEGSQLHKSIDKVDFSTSVVMWHLVTDVEGHVAHRKARDEVREILSRRGKMIRVDADDPEAVRKMLEAGVEEISDPAAGGAAPEGVDVVFASNSYETMRPVLPRAWRLAQMLLLQPEAVRDGDADEGGGTAPAAPWEMIASV